MPLTMAASSTFCLGRMNPLKPSFLASMAIGKDPIDGKVKELLIFYQTLHEIKTLIVNEDENVELAGKIIVAHATEDSKRKQIIKHKDQPSALTLGSLLSGNSTISGKGFIIPFPPPQIK